jgi:hypothetical protein
MVAARRDDVLVMFLPRGPERYLFLYEESRAREVVATVLRFAADPSLSFTFADACLIAKRVAAESDSLGGVENPFHVKSGPVY